MENQNNKKIRCAISGAAGFVGSHFVEHFIKNTDWDIIVLDKLTYASNGFDRLKDIKCYNTERVQTFTVDLNEPLSDGVKKEIGEVDYIINLASESHVDNSIKDPVNFIKNNVNLILNMLEWARELKGLKKFIQFSCYDKKTRAVTKDGLKYYYELTPDDYVLTLNSKKEPEFQKIDKVIVQDYSGEMIKFGGISNLLVTPNHRMYDDKMNVVEASEIKNRFDFPKNIATKNKDVETIYVEGLGELNANDLMYLIGVFIGDGFTAYQKKIKIVDRILKKNKLGKFYSVKSEPHENTSKSYRIFFDVPENDKARKKLEEILTRLGFNWHSEKGRSGEHIYLTSKYLLKFFDENIGKGAKNKRIPEFCFNLGKNNLQSLYDGLIDSDGYYGKNYDSYTTVSDKLVSDIVLLSFLLGKRTSVGYRYSEGKYNGRIIKGGANQIVITNGKLATKQISKEFYDDKIWCITVKNKNFLVEREGKYCFSGNTDEVFSTAPEGVKYKEGDRHNPGNPYSASKSAQEAIARAYANTYGIPINITNTMNIIGERQHPEKFVPLCIRKIINGETIQIHSDPTCTKSGTRFYLHARNVAMAVHFILTQTDEKLDKEDASKGCWNIVGEREIANSDLAKMIGEIIGKEAKIELVNFHQSRPGHDLRYALDGSKLKKTGFEFPINFEDSLKKTVEWSLKDNNKKWLRL